MSNKPLVSVIITTYNREKYFEEAVLSVVNQSFKNLEILVVDDGSDFNYAEKICKKYEKCFYFPKKNGGVSSARNYGVNKARGKFIAFLDDDDLWKKHKLEIQVKILKNNLEIDCVHSSLEVIDSNGELTNKIIGASKNKSNKRSGYVFWNALGVWLVKASTPVLRKKVFKNFKFDENLEVGEDVDFYQRMFYLHKVYYVRDPLALYREHNDETKLSLKKNKYLGLEQKIFNNFLKMDIKNPITMHRIASKLLICHAIRLNSINNNTLKLSFFDKYFFPQKKLKVFKFKYD